MANRGIIINGGSMHATNVAAGDNATINQNQTGESPALRATLDQLQRVIELLEQHAQIPNRDEVLQSAQTVKQELSKEKPNRVTLTGLLQGIAESVKSAGAVATAVEGLRQAAMLLFT